MLSLLVVRGPDRGRAFPLPECEPQLIGRSTEALDLTDISVSRRHAELTPENDQWLLRDLSSRHGTFINGVRVMGSMQLSEGDRVRCGDTELLVVVEGRAPSVLRDAATTHDVLRVNATVATSDDSMVQREAACVLALATLAAEPTDADAFLVAATKQLARDCACETSVIRDFEGMLVATHETLAPLELVRRAIDSGELLTTQMVVDGGARATLFIVPLITHRSIRGALVLQRASLAAPNQMEITLSTRAAEITSLALAARQQQQTHSTQERLAMIGETVAALSHSIKNILQGLRFSADAIDLALSRGELTKAQEGWPILQRNLDRIHALVLNMLAWTKERPLEPEPTDLNDIVREVRDLLAPMAARRRVGIALVLDPALTLVSIDAAAIHQALNNLTINAIEASPERVGLITIRTRTDSARDEVSLSVSDNGEGIPDPVRARLFEPFVSSKGQRGTGLGLAVARKIAQRHGGRLEVVSTSPRGTEIALSLPVVSEEFDPSATRAPRSSESGEFGWKFGP
jgi:signal transduction histidine kinase